MKRLKNAGGTAGAVTVMLLGVFLILSSCDAGFQLDKFLDGDTGEPLSISPETARVGVDSQLTFEAAGGYPPYTFTVDGAGAIDDESGLYTAPSSAGSATVTVTDLVRNNTTAIVTIVDPANLFTDYQVDSVSWVSGTTAGLTVHGTFEYSNIGDDRGVSEIDWEVFASDDPNPDTGTDHHIDIGTQAPLAAGESSGPITFDGPLPDEGGNYYLIVLLHTAPDDTIEVNNAGASDVVEVNPEQIEYTVTEVTSTYPLNTTNSTIDETFTYRNIGTIAGEPPVTYSAYVSSDDVLGGDTQVVTDQPVAALGGTVTSLDIDIDGLWPAAPGTYYLFVEISAADDTDLTNNIGAAGPFSISPPPDYTVSFVDFPVATYGGNTGQLLSETATEHDPLAPDHAIQISNGATYSGTREITWTVYESNDGTTRGAVAASGTIPPLAAAPDSEDVVVDFNLPTSPGAYYYIAEVTADDDSNGTNNEALTAPGPVYVWRMTGNSDPETNENNKNAGLATDFFILLNDGDTVFITDLIDQYSAMENYRDSFKVRVGPDTTRLQARLEWLDANPAGDFLNLEILDSSRAWVAESTETDDALEPADGVFFTVSSLTSDTFYYVDPISIDPGGEGESYTLEIKAGP